jgi:hypothetical protein
MKKDSDLEGMHYEMLMEWLNTGKSKAMPDEMLLYLEQINKARGWKESLLNENAIVKALMADYPELTRTAAKTRYKDAYNYYYLDDTVKKEAHINWYASLLDKLISATIKSAKEPKDYDIARKLIESIITTRKLLEDKIQEIPGHALEYKQPIFVMDPTLVELPKTNRDTLKKQIQAFRIKEKEKQEAFMDAGVEPYDLEKKLSNE